MWKTQHGLESDNTGTRALLWPRRALTHLVPLTCCSLFPAFGAPGPTHSGSVGSGLCLEVWLNPPGDVISVFMCMAGAAV